MPALNASLLLVLLACLLQHYHLACGTTTGKPVTIDAALTTVSGNLYLLADGHIGPVSQSTGSVIGAANNSGTFVGNFERIAGRVQACFMSFNGERIFLYGATESCRVNATSGDIMDCFDYRRGRRGFLAGGGPDAAAKKGDKRYVFKGCQYFIRKSIFRWSKPRDIRDLGLPCHLDAAWTNGTSLVALRGNQLWFWKEDESVEGPIPFESVIHADMWFVQPYTGSEE